MRYLPCFAALSLMTVLPSPIHADEGSADERAIVSLGEPERCIPIGRVSRSQIVDSSNILFYLNNATIYLNTLPRRCGSMRRQDGIAYKTSINRLCNVDTITVIRSGGSRGSTCGLGMFRPISKEQAALLRSGDMILPEPDTIQPEIEATEEDG